MLFGHDALWQHQVVANAVPPDPAAVVVPAAGWLGPSEAPFGTIGAGFLTSLSVGTAWDVGDGLWLRRALVVDGLASVILRGEIENACYVYLDGDFIGAVNPANATVENGGGFELIIPQSLLGAGAHQLAVLCLDEDPDDDATTWVWVEADYLPAVLPLWASPPLNETVAWLTNVDVYENGSEDREPLRNDPRHQYRVNCFVPLTVQAAIKNVLYGARASQWMVPVWSQMQRLGAVAADEATLDAVTSYSEYLPGSRLILWESETNWQVIGIDQVVDANTISLTGLTAEFNDAWVAPVRRAFLEGDPSRTFNGRTSRLSMTLNVEDNWSLTVAAPEQYLGNDIYFDPGLFESDTSDEEVATRFELFDERLGLVTYSTPWLHNRPSRPHRMMAEGAEEAWALREWLHRRAGRYRPFWHPSFEIDLRVQNAGAVAANLIVAADEYLRFASARDHLAIETTAGWVARAVIGTAVIGGQVHLTLNAALGVDASAILRVCFLGLRRLNSDRVEINWMGGCVCACSVPVLDIEP
jgi:hypothetical protein